MDEPPLVVCSGQTHLIAATNMCGTLMIVLISHAKYKVSSIFDSMLAKDRWKLFIPESVELVAI